MNRAHWTPCFARRRKTAYELCVKRPVDIVCALLAIIFFSWLYAVIAVMVRTKLGSPVIFKQKRPGMNEQIFTLYKFRTMTDGRDKDGNLLPDRERLTTFGKWLRGTSLDELPEVLNILKGDMSLVGPRPQLVRDMVFMSDADRQRHTVRPGLTGLAQVNGRNNATWEERFAWDLKYINGGITFIGDMKIILSTVRKVFSKSDINTEGMDTSEDYGDYLLRTDRVDKQEYDRLQVEARKILEEA